MIWLIIIVIILERQQRVCIHCAQSGQSVMETLEQMVFSCPSYTLVREHYPCLNFINSSLVQFLQQDPVKLASFATACWRQYHNLKVMDTTNHPSAWFHTITTYFKETVDLRWFILLIHCSRFHLFILLVDFIKFEMCDMV